METLQIQNHFKLSIVDLKSKEIKINAQDNIINAEAIARGDAYKLEINYENKQTNSLLLISLLSKSETSSKSAVIFTEPICFDSDFAKLLIREALMVAWEIGYNVAFAYSANSIFLACGFKEVDTIFPLYNYELPLLCAELSWNGIEKIPRDLVFPLSFNPYKILS